MSIAKALGHVTESRVVGESSQRRMVRQGLVMNRIRPEYRLMRRPTHGLRPWRGCLEQEGDRHRSEAEPVSASLRAEADMA